MGSNLRKMLKKSQETIGRNARTVPKAGGNRWSEFRLRILRTWVDFKLEDTIPSRTRSLGCCLVYYRATIPSCITFPIFITKRVIRSIRRSRFSNSCTSVSLRKCAVICDNVGKEGGTSCNGSNGSAFNLGHSGIKDDVPLEDWRSANDLIRTCYYSDNHSCIHV
ncbi:hypothetical protein BDZ45DRAFT_174239 [Acephala macrosclerotiorum]|nr:hypothetical protein BDZ45DRAFT_174239 [Acephala macrosclerotiorum]